MKCLSVIAVTYVIWKMTIALSSICKLLNTNCSEENYNININKSKTVFLIAQMHTVGYFNFYFFKCVQYLCMHPSFNKKKVCVCFEDKYVYFTFSTWKTIKCKRKRRIVQDSWNAKNSMTMMMWCIIIIRWSLLLQYLL